ncbi:expressed unknown protein [Seminavis robusta]|uniref:Uncharacterized protein n=1 Tax=Seminavis robusta TaxID=568900 RepID=A0A9N8DQB2_9STRA|nr:expressed unknown protein [Seminavis robusta]|eukprot:Sro208_g087130.1 n/a (233) ;mRNA; f:64612-65415
MLKLLLLLSLIACKIALSASFCHSSGVSSFRSRSGILLHATKSDDSSSATTTTTPWTLEQLQEHALQEGVELSISTLGPGFRTVARSTHNSSAILGYGEGFVRPNGDILHLDKMEVFSKMVKQARRDNPDFRGGGNTFGVGLLFGYQCLLHGAEQGCKIAEFLAIDDEDFQHRRLVRFYSRSGFEVIKYIGDDFQDIPARMVWGGCGTLMRANIDDLLPLWTQILSKSKSTQ